MVDDVPRVRMFAGPNGSGKSTIKGVVRNELLGHYLNADDIELALDSDSGLDLAPFSIDFSESELLAFLRAHPLLQRAGLSELSVGIRLDGKTLRFGAVAGNSYFAAVVADFVRRKLLDQRTSFSFETVMSPRDKVLLFKHARVSGNRTYLYYLATEDPLINVSRWRVESGWVVTTSLAIKSSSATGRA